MDTLQNTLQTNGATLKEMGLDLTFLVNLLAQFEANGVDATTALAGLKKAQQNATADGKDLKDALGETIEKIKNASKPKRTHCRRRRSYSERRAPPK